jgi:small subunit ribosomal protein S16
MLMVRLQRVGRKHEPVFRLVLTDSKNGPKSGKFLEILGNFDARRSEKAEFKVDRIKHWMGSGAKLSNTVHNLLVERKVIAGKKINALPKKSPIISEKAPEAETKKVAEETPV